MQTDIIRVALVGCGHMGTHHARVIAAHPGCRLVAAIDLVAERAEQLARRHGARAMTQVPRAVDAVVVATPTSTHVEVAVPLLERGLWCLVEKPLAPTVPEAEPLLHPQLVVGHCERFNSAVRSLGRLPEGPLRLEASRCAPPTGRSADIDVVLDLMVHDLDLALTWSGGGDVVVEEVSGDEDAATARLRLGRVQATLHASRRAEAPVRRLTLDLPGGRVEMDMLAGRARREGRLLPRVDDRDALTAQWDAFVGTIRGLPPRVDAPAGLRALRLAERIGAALRDRGRV